MKTLLASMALSLALAGSAFAGDVTADRQTVMKNVGAATGMGAKMLKGEIEFSAAAANLVLRTMNTAALGYGHLFPEGSESGNDTEASPAIWSDRAGFDAAVAKFVSDTSANVSDMDSFKAAFGAATANCGACHKAYRVKN